MTYLISKDFHFSAAHQLDDLPADHQCSRLHGHNYLVRVELEADELDDTGFVLDYGELRWFGNWLDEHLDHRNLNETVEPNPTAENLARLLAALLELRLSPAAVIVAGVGVSETPKTWAWWRP